MSLATLERRLASIEAQLAAQAAAASRDDAWLRERWAAEANLADFIQLAWPTVEPFTPYLHNWHIDAICEHLEAACQGEIRNLLVTMPPRMMKSLTISVFFPAWRWIKAPGERFLYSSYSQDLATDHSVATRRVIESGWYQERWGDRFRMAPDQNLKTRFENTRRGARVSTSVNGPVTGKGADWLVCDDPHNVRDADSLTIREATLRWWDEAMSSRFNNPRTGRRIVVMQRVHEADLAGHLIEQGGYVHLNLPMEYEPEATTYTGFGQRDIRTEPGQLLMPERIGEAEVADLKVRLGSRAYAGQYQQRPAPAEGDLLKRAWWRFWHHPGAPLPAVPLRLPSGEVIARPCIPLPARFTETLQSWDMTFKDTKETDFVVGQVWGAVGADRFLLDQVRARLDFPGTIAAFRGLSTTWPAVRRKLVEDKANGPAVIATLGSEIGGITAVNPEGGKVARANAVAPYIESGNYYLPHPAIAPWVNGFVEECASFPTGRHDDQVDAMSQAGIRLEKLMAHGHIETLPVLQGGTLFPVLSDEDEDDVDGMWGVG